LRAAIRAATSSSTSSSSFLGLCYECEEAIWSYHSFFSELTLGGHVLASTHYHQPVHLINKRHPNNYGYHRHEGTQNTNLLLSASEEDSCCRFACLIKMEAADSSPSKSSCERRGGVGRRLRRWAKICILHSVSSIDTFTDAHKLSKQKNTHYSRCITHTIYIYICPHTHCR
jgi:hypothetical protein